MGRGKGRSRERYEGCGEVWGRCGRAYGMSVGKCVEVRGCGEVWREV